MSTDKSDQCKIEINSTQNVSISTEQANYMDNHKGVMLVHDNRPDTPVRQK